MAELAQLDGNEADKMEYSAGYPVSTQVTDKLIVHANALLKLFASKTPLMPPLCPTDVHKIRYTIGDASAKGFFIGTQYPDLSLYT